MPIPSRPAPGGRQTDACPDDSETATLSLLTVSPRSPDRLNMSASVGGVRPGRKAARISGNFGIDTKNSLNRRDWSSRFSNGRSRHRQRNEQAKRGSPWPMGGPLAGGGTLPAVTTSTDVHSSSEISRHLSTTTAVRRCRYVDVCLPACSVSSAAVINDDSLYAFRNCHPYRAQRRTFPSNDG